MDNNVTVHKTKAVFAHNLSGKHFNPTSCGVIRNQRSEITSTFGGGGGGGGGALEKSSPLCNFEPMNTMLT